jgi:hypothetical protein
MDEDKLNAIMEMCTINAQGGLCLVQDIVELRKQVEALESRVATLELMLTTKGKENEAA